MTKSPKTIALKAAALIRQGFTQGQFALNKKGQPVAPDSRAAVCWCALGAIWRARGRVLDYDSTIETKFYEKINGGDIAEWNDSHTQEEVATMLETIAEELS